MAILAKHHSCDLGPKSLSRSSPFVESEKLFQIRNVLVNFCSDLISSFLGFVHEKASGGLIIIIIGNLNKYNNNKIPTPVGNFN